MTVTPLRFGLSAPGYADLDRLLTRARWAERVGFATFSLSDHLDAASPLVTLGALAAATSHLELGTLVINNDLRHPALLAQDAATLDRLSGGRLELGLGAGWARAEYVRAGIAYDPPPLRLARLEATVDALIALWDGAPVTTAGPFVALRNHVVVPRPTEERGLRLLIGGNGDRTLRLGARRASVVGFTGFGPDIDGNNVRSHFSRAGLAERVDFVRRHSTQRDTPPELQILLQVLTITDDREFLAESFAQRLGRPLVDVLTCPFLVFGTVEEICAQLTRLQDDFGIGYVTVFDPYADATARVIAALRAEGR